jgi:hypothetical protein
MSEKLPSPSSSPWQSAQLRCKADRAEAKFKGTDPAGAATCGSSARTQDARAQINPQSHIVKIAARSQEERFIPAQLRQ